MQFDELLAELTSREIALQKSGDDLVVVGNREHLTEGLMAELRTQKAALLGLVPEASQVPITPSTLLDALEKAPGTTVRNAELLAGEERQRVVYEWNDTKAEYPREKCIHELFEQQVERSPDAVAVVLEGKELTYGELNRRANQLAHYLRELGVRPDERVAICVERGFEMVVALLAVLKAGGGYVPLDPGYPEERLHYMLEDSKPAVLLTQRGLRNLFKGMGEKLPVVDLADATAWSHVTKTNPDKVSVGLTAEHLAYVIYTSGSTGRPKGVMVEHRGVVNQLNFVKTRYGLSEQDRILQFASITFDMSVEDIIGALHSGAALVPRTDSCLASDREFWTLCRVQNITIVNLPTSFWQQLHGGCHAVIPGCVRQVMIGGEAVHKHALMRWHRRRGAIPRLFNAYGPTETTINAAIHEVGTDLFRYRSIGRPTANTQIYILDKHGELVPIGVAGEIYIGGDGVARGYWKRPELTAERFVQDPFVLHAGARMYKTGDLGRWLADGNIEFLGRNDDQVKIRGYRIELGEIETQLASHSGVREAVVVAREDEPGEKRLVAYYTNADDQVIEAQELRAYLSARLPQYMVPAGYVRLERLPLTPNGKLDRKGLPAPEYNSQTQYRAPKTYQEAVLCDLFAEVLGLTTVGLDDDFMQLGGHSLMVARLFLRVHETCGWLLSWRVFPRSITPALIIQQIQSNPQPAQASVLAVPEWNRASPPIPLSSSQRRIWFIHQLEADNTAYQFAAKILLTGPLDVVALERSLNTIAERHDIFRTTFHAVDGEPQQQIHPFRPFSLISHTSSIASEWLDRTEVEALVQREAMTRFRLDELPLVRWTLVQLGKQEHLLIHVEHHLIHDGWSFNVFLSELTRAYNCYVDCACADLPTLNFQFADYAAWEKLWLQCPAADHQLVYWKTQLSLKYAQTRLPYDRPRNTKTSFRGSSARFALDLSLCKRLRSTSVREGVTLFMTMCAAFAALISRYSGQPDILIGSGIANRRHANSRQLIGMFINTVILRFNITDNVTVRGLLREVRHIVVDAFENQEFPLDRLVEILRPPRVPGMNPLFQTMFNFDDDSAFSGVAMKGMKMAVQDPLSTGGAKVDLNITAIPCGHSRTLIYPDLDPDAITLIWEYNRDLFDASTVDRMMGHYVRMLEAFVRGSAEKLIAGVDVLSAHERQHVLRECNATRQEYPREKCVHELFEEQVERSPEAVAVVFEEQKLTYGELNRRANHLAHYLRELGVKPDERVAICIERGFEMVVALLAVLKAGGGYVPLDPGYPEERLRYMVEDSEPVVLLTQGHLHGLFRRVRESMPVLDLAGGAPPWSGQPDSNPKRGSVGLRPEHLAYIIYTSGSTGKPKGVMVEHRSVVNYLWWALGTYVPTEGAIVSSSFSFDGTVTSVYGPILCGGAIQLLVEREEIDGLNMLIRRGQGHGLVKISPSHLDLLGMLLGNCRHSVKVFVIGGERLSPSTVRLWQQIQPDIRMVNEYGPTEATVGCVVYEISQDSELSESVPIGRPTANTQIYILDKHGEPVPIGVAGEIYIGGDGVARGYLNRPELTAERFLADPFTDEAGARMYRTGDLGRWLADGNIEFLGRNDDQVKIRGYRIELGEIETQLASHSGVREAVVVAREDEPGEKRLVAYYTNADDQVIEAQELRAYLSARLPQYMVPAGYVRLERLPLTPNGKLDRKGLPLPEGDAYAVREYEEPRGEAEKKLAEIWAEVLKVERVGRHDNFFDLGGHSLLAIRLANCIRITWGVELAIRALVDSPSLWQLGDLVEGLLLDQVEQIPEHEAIGLTRSLGPSEWNI